MDSLLSFLVSAVSQLFDVDGLDDVADVETLDAVQDFDRVPVEPQLTEESSVLPRPWFETIVDDTKGQIDKIERGEWTSEDATQLSKSVEGAHKSHLMAQGQTHWDQSFQSTMSDGQLRTAQDAVWQAESLAGRAQLDYQTALQSGDQNRIQSAFGQLQSALYSCESAGRAAQNMQSSSH